MERGTSHGYGKSNLAGGRRSARSGAVDIFASPPAALGPVVVRLAGLEKKILVERPVYSDNFTYHLKGSIDEIKQHDQGKGPDWSREISVGKKTFALLGTNGLEKHPIVNSYLVTPASLLDDVTRTAIAAEWKKKYPDHKLVIGKE